MYRQQHQSISHSLPDRSSSVRSLFQDGQIPLAPLLAYLSCVCGVRPCITQNFRPALRVARRQAMTRSLVLSSKPLFIAESPAPETTGPNLLLMLWKRRQLKLLKPGRASAQLTCLKQPTRKVCSVSGRDISRISSFASAVSPISHVRLYARPRLPRPWWRPPARCTSYSVRKR
jgi:hypothetical protein